MRSMPMLTCSSVTASSEWYQRVLGLRNRMSESEDKTGDVTDLYPGTGAAEHTGAESEKDRGAGHGSTTTEENARNTSTSPTGRSGAMYTEQSMRELRTILTHRQLTAWGDLCRGEQR